MKETNVGSFCHITDPATEEYLLPFCFRYSTNSDDIACCKIALAQAIEESLPWEQQKIIVDYYWNNKTKTQIAKELGVVPSTVVKKMKQAEDVLRKQVEFALGVYKKQKQQNFLS